MRVISGKARGARLEAPPGLSVRPTLDRVKEAIFSMLTGKLVDATALDLFAGSGALGIEALSRGAKSACFVDKSPASLAAVTANLNRTRLLEYADVVRAEALSFLHSTNLNFDVIFLDPPYAKGLLPDVLESICKYQVLKQEGIIVAEFDQTEPFSINETPYSVLRDKTYGRVRILLLKEL